MVWLERESCRSGMVRDDGLEIFRKKRRDLAGGGGVVMC